MSTTKNDNELKPVSRTRSPGWSQSAKIINQVAFIGDIPCMATAIKDERGICFLPDWQNIKKDNVGWCTTLFTYEKIETDGNG